LNVLDDPSIIDVDEVTRALGADVENGLASKEAARRLALSRPTFIARARKLGVLE